MRTVIILLFTSVFISVAETGYTQNAKVTLNKNNVNLKEVLNEIENQTDYLFIYNNQVNTNKTVSVKTKKGTVRKVLNHVLKDSDINFLMEGNHIILSYNEEKLRERDEEVVETLQQQGKTVTGTIVDEQGEPIIGANIIEKGTSNGTITDIDGNFSLNVGDDTVLRISYIGYLEQEVVTQGRNTINVTLLEDTKTLDELVVVGYGTQKRVNLTGSVATMGGEDIQNKAISRTAQGLAGELSGVSIRQSQGNPGRDTPEIIIRGYGTFSDAGNSPLVIVDGVPSLLDAVNPNDIKSISVLKDAASASIYGARAANGVVLIETKTGRLGETKISYNSYIGKQVITKMPDFLNSWEYAGAYNEALTNTGIPPLYNDEDIQKFKSGVDPDNYPNYPHYKEMYSSGSGLQTRHDLTLTTGTQNAQVYFSLGYLKNEGIVMKNSNDRYNMRLNANTKLKDNLHFSVKLHGSIGEWEEPRSLLELSKFAMRLPNTIPGKKTDGSYGHIENAHPLASLESGGFYRSENKDIGANLSLSWNIFKDLKITGVLGYEYNNLYNKNFLAEYDVTPIFSVKPNSLTVSNVNSSNLILQTLLNYDKTFGNHTVNLLGGFSSEDNNSNILTGFRDKFPTNLLPELDVGSVDNRNASGSSTQNRLISYFGRGNYSYLDKYLFEANFRYDGTSRLPYGRKFDIFPSFSAGWRISEEEFIQNISLIDELKIRASWGELGNQSIGDYPYQAVISLGQDSPIGGSLSSGAAINTLPNPNIIWETTRITDVGFDLAMFKNKLNLTVDYYNKRTSDILYPVSASDMLGATPSIENAALVENKGFDFDLIYRNNFKDFTYSISTNFTTINNKVLEIANLDIDINRRLFVGHPIGSFYGYVSDGLFVDENDIANYPTQPYVAIPGSIRIKDINGPDGVPDGKITSHDRQVLGSENSKYMYGFRFDAKYKNWDANIVFQGEAGGVRGMAGWMHAFNNAGNIQRWEWEQRWSHENPNPNAGYPILMTTDRPEPTSDFFFFPADYLRLKNIQIGYNLPSIFIQRLNIVNARVFVSGTNLLTFDRNQEGWDPEMSVDVGSGGADHNPLTSIYTFGINIDF